MGNKRTGLLAAIVFLDLNGVAISDPEGRLYDAMIAIAERRMEKPELGAILQASRPEAAEPLPLTRGST